MGVVRNVYSFLFCNVERKKKKKKLSDILGFDEKLWAGKLANCFQQM